MLNLQQSAVLTGGKPGPHKIQGIGTGFIPTTLDTDIYDEVIRVTDEEAFTTGAEIGRKEGILVGIFFRLSSIRCT